MITQSLIPEILRDFDYYKRKLPLYLRSSKTFQEHFRIWYEVLVGNTGHEGVVGNAEILLNMLNIFASDYFDFLSTVEGSSKDDTTSDILDKIGNLFDISRYLTVTYTIPSTTTVVENESLVLTNEELLILIKARIIQNYCDGSLKQINDYYELMGLPIVVRTVSEAPATAEMYFIVFDDHALTNTEKIFLAGLLKIESMGVNYRFTTYNNDTVLVWDRYDASKNNGWDGGQWTI